MKKTTTIALSLAFAFGAFAGTASAASQLETVVDELVGIGYKYAGSTTDGFDCSGFTSYVFANFGVELPRVSADQATLGTKVSKDELRAGDLVFFNTSGKRISHVGIYMGDGTFAHASTSKGITITEMDDRYYAKRYVTARRILSDKSYVALATEQTQEHTQGQPQQPLTAESLPMSETNGMQAAAAAISAADIVLSTEAAELAAEHAPGTVDPADIVEALRAAM